MFIVKKLIINTFKIHFNLKLSMFYDHNKYILGKIILLVGLLIRVNCVINKPNTFSVFNN